MFQNIERPWVISCLENTLLPITVARTSQVGHSVEPQAQESANEELLLTGVI